MIPILLHFIYVYWKMLLWSPLFQAFCGFLGSVRTQEKVTEKHEVKWLFQVGYQGATSFSLACDEERRWHGVQEPSQPPGPQGLPPASRRSRKGIWLPTKRHHLHHMCQGFNAQNREAWRPGFADKSIPCKETHIRRRSCLEGRWPRTKGRLRYQLWSSGKSGPH